MGEVRSASPLQAQVRYKANVVASDAGQTKRTMEIAYTMEIVHTVSSWWYTKFVGSKNQTGVTAQVYGQTSRITWAPQPLSLHSLLPVCTFDLHLRCRRSYTQHPEMKMATLAAPCTEPRQQLPLSTALQRHLHKRQHNVNTNVNRIQVVKRWVRFYGFTPTVSDVIITDLLAIGPLG